ncbi:MAG: monovalent cation/H(+) antiporter subunit G [Phycisphaeraceae bacterium]
MSFATYEDILVALTLVTGTFLMMLTGIGLIRLPDVYCRMHAAGKAGTLGISMIILAAVIFFAPTQLSVVYRGLLAIFFQFLTTPAATHLLARASYIRDYPLTDRTAVDELKTYLPSTPDADYGKE